MTRMINLMLHDTAEHVVKVVIIFGLAGNLVLQARVRKSGNRLDELAVSLLKMAQSLPPGSWTGVFYWREILFLRELDGYTPNAPTNGIIPGGDMQDELPDSVRVLDWPGRSGRGVDVSQQFEHGITVPGVALEGAADLVSETSSFGHERLLERFRVQGDRFFSAGTRYNFSSVMNSHVA